jgi:hypothetical protein
MNNILAARRPMDLVVGRRVFSACWFSASLGLSMLQLRLLAQAWQQSQQALVPACLMSVWILGTIVGLRLSNATRAWGAVTSAFALVWFAGPSLVMWHLPLRGAPPFMLSIVPLALVALFLGASSTAWLAQPRSWPAAGERTVFARSLLGLTVGLVVVWTLPTLVGLLALACCLPLLTLDACSPRRAPLPLRGSVAAAWIDRYWRVEQPPLQLEQCALPRGWYWIWLMERSQSSKGYLWLTLLASGVAVIPGSIWCTIPTPFAAGLAVTHSLAKLDWLLAGQLSVVTLVAVLLAFTWRGVIGFPDRLVPPSWQAQARLLAAVVPLGMAAGLVGLGLPLLQAPWWLAVSLAGYTLASAVWSLLLPRLRPTVSTQVQAQRHLLLRQGTMLPTTLHLAHRSAQEVQVTRRLATVEGLLIALLTPLLGWLIDARGNVDPVLVGVGLAFLVVLLVGAAVVALIPKLRRTMTPHRAVLRVTRHTAHATPLGLARTAW